VKRYIISFIILTKIIFGCLWISGTTIDGSYTNQNPRDDVQLEILSRQIKVKPKQLIKNIDNFSLIDDKSPKEEREAIVMILKGDYSKAIEKLLECEKKYPNRYSVASNLGTAYELNGENKKALKWISEDLRRDPNSHYKTEWLHRYILKLKVEHKDISKYLKIHRVIELPKKFNNDTKILVDKKYRTVKSIRGSIYYQLRERVLFVKPKDPIVADLLYTLAIINANTSNLENATKFLNLAKMYGFVDEKKLLDDKDRYNKIISTSKLSPMWHINYILDDPSRILLYILFLLIVLLIFKLFKNIAIFLKKR